MVFVLVGIFFLYCLRNTKKKYIYIHTRTRGPETMPVSRRNGFRADIVDPLTYLENGGEYIYAIWDGSAIKIGSTCNHPVLRCRMLQVGNLKQLRLVAYTIKYAESKVHSMLHKFRIRGEWFKVCSETVQEISGWCWVDVTELNKVRSVLTEK